MPDASDIELLRDYDRQGSEAAFAELVRRHINLVYSVALRHVGIAAHAEEITQAVFVILARKAAGLHPGIILEGWLHETTRLTALSFLRGERRRHFREQEAYMQSTLQEYADASVWNHLAPLLDEAMSRLGKKDRDAVILRFFKEKNVREVAATLQVNEAAAQRRILRALDKLRKFFTKRGVSSTTAIIAGAISANSVQAAPVALAKSVTAVAIVKGSIATASTLTLVKGTIKIMTCAKLKLALGIGMAALLAGSAVTIALSDVGNKTATLPDNRSNSPQTMLAIASECVEVPDNLLENLGINWQPTDSGGATAMLTKSQHTNILGTLKHTRDVALPSQSSIAFPPSPGMPRQGTVAMVKPVKISGTNAETGTILNVVATLSSDSKSVNLDLDAEWLGLADASPLHDGSQNTIRTTKATAVATLTLNPVQTILIRQPIDGKQPALGGTAEGSKSVLVFVTPQLSRFTQRLQRIIKIKPPQSTGAGAIVH